VSIGAKALIDSVVGIGWLLRQDIKREDAAKVLVVYE
jgi:hypothetical protein